MASQSALRTPYSGTVRQLLTQQEQEQALLDKARADRASGYGPLDSVLRGWQSTGAGFQAGDLNQQALEHEQLYGQDSAGFKGLRSRADLEGQRAGILGNRVQRLDQIEGAGDLWEFAGGAMGGGARSMLPIMGAALPGAVVGGPVGAVLSGAGAMGVGYDMNRGENVTEQYADPEVMQRSAQERSNAASLTAAGQAALDAFVPGRAAFALRGAAKTLPGTRVADTLFGMGTEGLTEVGQKELGFQSRQALGSTAERDPVEYWSEGVAGALGAGPVTGGSNVVGHYADKAADAGYSAKELVKRGLTAAQGAAGKAKDAVAPAAQDALDKAREAAAAAAGSDGLARAKAAAQAAYDGVAGMAGDAMQAGEDLLGRVKDAAGTAAQTGEDLLGRAKKKFVMPASITEYKDRALAVIQHGDAAALKTYLKNVFGSAFGSLSNMAGVKEENDPALAGGPITPERIEERAYTLNDHWKSTANAVLEGAGGLQFTDAERLRAQSMLDAGEFSASDQLWLATNVNARYVGEMFTTMRDKGKAWLKDKTTSRPDDATRKNLQGVDPLATRPLVSAVAKLFGSSAAKAPAYVQHLMELSTDFSNTDPVYISELATKLAVNNPDGSVVQALRASGGTVLADALEAQLSQGARGEVMRGESTMLRQLAKDGDTIEQDELLGLAGYIDTYAQDYLRLQNRGGKDKAARETNLLLPLIPVFGEANARTLLQNYGELRRSEMQAEIDTAEQGAVGVRDALSNMFDPDTAQGLIDDYQRLGSGKPGPLLDAFIERVGDMDTAGNVMAMFKDLQGNKALQAGLDDRPEQQSTAGDPVMRQSAFDPDEDTSADPTAIELSRQGINEVDTDNLRAGFKLPTSFTPYFTGNERDMRLLQEDLDLNPGPDSRAVTMSEYADTIAGGKGLDKGLKGFFYKRIRKDVLRRLHDKTRNNRDALQLEAEYLRAQNDLTPEEEAYLEEVEQKLSDPRVTSVKGTEALVAQLATLNELGEDALDLYKVRLTPKDALAATDEQMEKFSLLLKKRRKAGIEANDLYNEGLESTRLTFRTRRGSGTGNSSKLSLSAESMLNSSPGTGSDLQRFSEALNSVLARKDIAGLFEPLSPDLVIRRAKDDRPALTWGMLQEKSRTKGVDRTKYAEDPEAMVRKEEQDKATSKVVEQQIQQLMESEGISYGDAALSLMQDNDEKLGDLQMRRAMLPPVPPKPSANDSWQKKEDARAARKAYNWAALEELNEETKQVYSERRVLTNGIREFLEAEYPYEAQDQFSEEMNSAELGEGRYAESAETGADFAQLRVNTLEDREKFVKGRSSYAEKLRRELDEARADLATAQDTQVERYERDTGNAKGTEKLDSVRDRLVREGSKKLPGLQARTSRLMDEFVTAVPERKREIAALLKNRYDATAKYIKTLRSIKNPTDEQLVELLEREEYKDYVTMARARIEAVRTKQVPLPKTPAQLAAFINLAPYGSLIAEPKGARVSVKVAPAKAQGQVTKLTDAQLTQQINTEQDTAVLYALLGERGVREERERPTRGPKSAPPISVPEVAPEVSMERQGQYMMPPDTGDLDSPYRGTAKAPSEPRTVAPSHPKLAAMVAAAKAVRRDDGVYYIKDANATKYAGGTTHNGAVWVNIGKLRNAGQLAKYVAESPQKTEVFRQLGIDPAKLDKVLGNAARRAAFVREHEFSHLKHGDTKSYPRLPNGELNLMHPKAIAIEVRATREAIEALSPGASREARTTAKKSSESDAESTTRKNRQAADINRTIHGDDPTKIAVAHNSPHKVGGKFEWEQHRGKGEGSAAFSEGHYVSTSDATSRHYKGLFSKDGDYKYQKKIEQLEADLVTLDHNIAFTQKFLDAAQQGKTVYGLRRQGGRIDVSDLALDREQAEINQNYASGGFYHSDKPDMVLYDGPVSLEGLIEKLDEIVAGYNRDIAKTRAKLEELNAGATAFEQGKSPTYSLTLDAQPDELLHWHKLVSMQDPGVQKRLEKNRFMEGLLDSAFEDEGQLTGKAVYNALKRHFKGDGVKASQYLRDELGFVAMEHYAQGGSQTDFPNYAVWNTDRLTQNYVHFNKQGASKQKTAATGKEATNKELQDELFRLLGKKPMLLLNKLIKALDGSGEFTIENGREIISVAIDAQGRMGVLRHEALHAFFRRLGNSPQAVKLKQALTAVASNPRILARLKELLASEPDALAQLEEGSSPHYLEERLAYMYQFWSEGLLEITPTGRNIFTKIAQFFRDLMGIVSQSQQADRILTLFHSGEFANDNDSTILSKIADNRIETANDKLQRVAPAFTKTMEKVFAVAPDRMRNTGAPSMIKLADKFEKFISERQQAEHQWMGRLNTILTGKTKAEISEAMETFQKMEDPTTPLELELAQLFSDMHDYMVTKGVKRAEWVPGSDGEPGYTAWMPLGKILKNYFPREFDGAAIQRNIDEWNKLLEKYVPDAIDRKNITELFIKGDGKHDIEESEHHLGFTPFAKAVGRRKLHFITKANAAEFAKFQSKDLVDTVSTYIQQAVHRGEYAEAFGNDGAVINNAIADAKLSNEQTKEMQDLARGMEGTLGWNMDKTTKETMTGILTMENAILLPLAIFSQMIDPLLISVRTGNLKDAGKAYLTALKSIRRTKSDNRKLAEWLGTVSDETVLSAMGNTYGSMYMSRGVRKFNRWFFKANGMQWWNSAMREAATLAGEQYIIDHKADADALAELGIKPSDVTLSKDGKRLHFDSNTSPLAKAMFKFVDQSVVRPSAATRAGWMSDPRFMLLAHLKQFTFTMHKVVLDRVAAQAEKGNYHPMKMLALATPVMLAADMAKWALTGSMPESWTFMDYLAHAVQRSGALGKYQFAADALNDAERGQVPGSSFLGPTAEHAVTLLRYLSGGVGAEEVIDRSVPLARHFTRNTFVGRTADPLGAQRAYKRLKTETADAVYEATGWFKGPDGHMRKEIDPKPIIDAFWSMIDTSQETQSFRLGDMLEKVPELAKRYDKKMGDVRVTVQPEPDDFMKSMMGLEAEYKPDTKEILVYKDVTTGDFSPDAKADILWEALQKLPQDIQDAIKEKVVEEFPQVESGVYVSDEEKVQVERDAVDWLWKEIGMPLPDQAALAHIASVFLHELQHGVQHAEGFENGGSPQTAIVAALLSKKKFAQFRRLINAKQLGRATEILNEAATIFMEENKGSAGEDVNALAHKLYKDIIGEAESHDVQDRLELTPEERRARKPVLMDASRKFLRSVVGAVHKQQLLSKIA